MLKRRIFMPEINLVGIGMALILIGFLIVIIGSLTGKDVKVGVGGIIGFIPFGFGNDPQLVKIAIIISAVMALVFLFTVLRGYRII